MKKIFIAAFLLPFSLFAVDRFPDQLYRVWLYTYSSSGSASTITTIPACDKLVIFDSLLSQNLGMRFTLQGVINQPDYSVTSPNVLTNSSKNISFCVEGNTDHCYYNLFHICPESRNLYSFCARLYVNGLNSSSYTSIFTNSSNQISLNFRPIRILADALVSTNTVFRSEALNYLSSINNFLSNIDTGVSSILSLLSNSSSSTYTASNVLASAEVLQSYANSNGFDLDLGKLAFDLDEDNYDSSPAGVSAFNAAVQSYGKGLDELSKLIGMASALNPNFPVDSRYNGLQQLGNAFNGSVDASVNDFKRLSTNWQEGVKKDLQDWRNDVTNRLAHMFDDSIPIDGGNSSPVYVSGQNGGPVGVSGVVRLEGPISVGATIEGAVTLDSTQFNQFSSGWESIKQSIIDFHNTFSDFTASGDLPFNWISFYRLFYDFQAHSLSNQLAIFRSFSVTNILNDIYAAITNNSTNVVFSAMLLDDYETFIDSSKFSDMLLAMPDNLSSMLRSFGLADSSEYAGRWWVFQTANSMLQSQLLITNSTLSALTLSALNEIDNSFDDDDDDDSLLSRWLSIISNLPDKEELDQAIESASNIVNNVGFDRVNVFYDRATNDFSAAISTMYQDRSLPPFLRITLVPESHGRPARFVDIPVAERSGLWSLFRSGMAYGLSIVTLILFPKYILWLLTRYTRLMEKIIKSLKAYTQL